MGSDARALPLPFASPFLFVAVPPLVVVCAEDDDASAPAGRPSHLLSEGVALGCVPFAPPPPPPPPAAECFGRTAPDPPANWYSADRSCCFIPAPAPPFLSLSLLGPGSDTLAFFFFLASAAAAAAAGGARGGAAEALCRRSRSAARCHPELVVREAFEPVRLRLALAAFEGAGTIVSGGIVADRNDGGEGDGERGQGHEAGEVIFEEKRSTLRSSKTRPRGDASPGVDIARPGAVSGQAHYSDSVYK